MEINNTLTPAVHKYPSNMFATIASLEDLAATSLVLDLWYHNQLGNFSMPRSKYDEPNFYGEQVLHVSLPQCVMKTINRRIRSMGGRELKALQDSLDVVLRYNYTFLKYFDSFMYGPDGEICPERTAKNLLSRDELIQWQKFYIACVYWLEDEIRQIWPSVSDHPNTTQPAAHSFVNYWIKKMRNCSTDSVPNGHHFIAMITSSGITKNLGNWTAYVKVLNKLAPDQQYNSIRSLAKNGIKKMLPKLNEEQVDYVLSAFPHHVIIGLAFQDGGFESAIKIWNLVRESIEFIKFYEILRFGRRRVYDPDKYEFPFFIRTQAQAVLLEVWNTAPNRLKIEFFNNGKLVERLFEYLTEIDIRHFHRLDDDINFISKLFSDLPAEMRSRIWRKYWPQIVYFSSPKMFNHLLSLGLMNNDYNEFVEKEMMNYAKVAFIMRRWWTNLKLYEKVINYTKLCSWNEQLVRQFRTRVFSELKFYDLDDLIKIDAAIGNSLPNFEAEKAKRNILSSFDFRKFSERKLGNELTKKKIRMVDSFLPSERSEQEKKLFLNHWVKFLSLDAANKVNQFYFQRNEYYLRWNEFLSWWVDNKDEVSIFKSFLSKDERFEELLLEILSTRLDALEIRISEPAPSSITKLEEFADVDEFLMWYFGNEEAVQNYKRSKISEKNSRLNNLLSINDESIVNRIIAWFFNYDEIEINQFKKEFFKKDLSN